MSTKKTDRQTISISPALKEWIKRYVNVRSRESPDDERFSSVSSFYNYILHKVMENFERGKSIKDFDSFVDGKVQEFYDEFSFKATIPFYEMVVETNRYTDFRVSDMLKFFISYRRFLLNNADFKKKDEVEKFLKRLEVYFRNNKLAKLLNLTLDKTTDYSKNPSIVLEVVAYYENLIFENLKFASGVLGFLGFKITDFLYSKKSKYSRIKSKVTSLFYLKDLERKERVDLYHYNIRFITNYKRVLNDDKDYYLWMKLASSKNLTVHFKDVMTRDRWMRKIEEDLQRFGSAKEMGLNILKYFDKLHWISLDNENPAIFRITIPEEKFREEREYILKKVSQYANVIERNEKYYLE
ncbi:MAG: hypothetical protein P8Y70_02480 [Candidatus Lokiarchaeota archaeon]